MNKATKRKRPLPIMVDDNIDGEPLYDSSAKMDTNAILKANAHVPFVDRILNADKYPVINNVDGTVSTHRMEWSNDDEGYHVYPTIGYDVDSNTLKDYRDTSGHSWDAWKTAKQNKDYLTFKTAQEAEQFTTQYKKNTPLAKYAGGGFLQNAGDALKNVGITTVNNITSNMGGIVGNPDLIPNIDPVGNRRMQTAFTKVNDVTNTISGMTGKLTGQIGLTALGVPPQVTGMIQQGVAGATQNIDNKDNADPMGRLFAEGGNIDSSFKFVPKKGQIANTMEKGYLKNESGEEFLFDQRGGVNITNEDTLWRQRRSDWKENNKFIEQHGMTRDDFYELYPTEEHYLRDYPVNQPELMKQGGNILFNPQYEAEKKEVVQHNPNDIPQTDSSGNPVQLASDLTKLNGPSHESGGVQMSGGERVFSDKLKHTNGKTYANEADRIGKAKGKLEKIIEDKESDEMARRSSKMMVDRYQKELDMLFEGQESQKQIDFQDFQRYGGMVNEKYKYGGVLPYDETAFNTRANALKLSPKAMTKRLSDMIVNYGDEMKMAFGGNIGNPPYLSDPDKLISDPDNLLGNSTPAPFDVTSLLPIEMQEGYVAPDKTGAFKPMTSITPSLMPDISQNSQRLEIPTELPNSSPSNNGIQLPDDKMKLLEGAAEYAPTAYNLFQGTLGKKDYYDRVDNKQLPKALEEIDASKRYTIDEILASNARGEQGIRTQAKSVSTNAGELLQTSLAANAQHRNADAAAYDRKNNFESDANARAAQLRNSIGQQERQEDQAVQMNQLQTDAIKRQHLEAGLTGVSDITQRNQMQRNQKEADMIALKTLESMSPTYAKYHLDKTLSGTQQGADFSEIKAQEAVSTLVKSGYNDPEQILTALNNAGGTTTWTIQDVKRLMRQ